MDENENRNLGSENLLGKLLTPLNIFSFLGIFLMVYLVYVFRFDLRDYLKIVNPQFKQIIIYTLFGTTFLLFFLSILKLIIPQELASKIIENITFIRIIYVLIFVFVGVFIYSFKDSFSDASKNGEYLILRFLISMAIIATTSFIGIKLVISSLETKDKSDEFKNFFQMAREVFTAFIAIVGTIMGFYYGNASSEAYKNNQANTKKTAIKEGWIYLGKIDAVGKNWTKAVTVLPETKLDDLKPESKINLTDSVTLRDETATCPRSKGEVIDYIEKGETVTVLDKYAICDIPNDTNTNVNKPANVNTNSTDTQNSNTNTSSTKEQAVWVKIIRNTEKK